MKKRNLRLIFLFSGICLPFFFLLSPKWITLSGVGPCWPVLWLLPWSLDKGKLFGLFAGFCLGILFDSFAMGSSTQIPALMLLGYWWGQEGYQPKSIDLSFNLGLLALIGAMVFSLSLWIQISFLESFTTSSWFHSWAFHTFLAKSILTGFLAPMTCSWILLARGISK